jgi:hypothetical protein
MDGLTGTSAIVQSGLDEARQSLFAAADVPLASADELAAAVSGAAVKAVLQARIEQIVKHGHSANADAERGPRILASDARTMILAGIDLLAPGPARNLAVARRRFAKGAAMMLAAIDAIDRMGVGE